MRTLNINNHCQQEPYQEWISMHYSISELETASQNSAKHMLTNIGGIILTSTYMYTKVQLSELQYKLIVYLLLQKCYTPQNCVLISCNFILECDTQTYIKFTKSRHTFRSKHGHKSSHSGFLSVVGCMNSEARILQSTMSMDQGYQG
jgi:hypothetical protein